jgi:hypothetical protein
MTIGTVERLRYYQRQFLGADDFEDQQTYHRSMRRRHNLAHHTCGIVTGLELVEVDKDGTEDKDIYVQPGMAVDGFGREIFVFQPHKVDFGNFPPPQLGQDVDVWIAYAEEAASRPANGYEICDGQNDFGRVRERYEVVVLPSLPYHDDIVVDGVERQTANLTTDANARASLAPLGIYPDESVPHQELPEDDERRDWLIKLGTVYWDGAAFKHFERAGPDKVVTYKTPDTAGRVYAGVVAAHVLAPQGALRIRDRKTDPLLNDLANAGDPTKHSPGIAVTLEGSLRVDRLLTAKEDAQIHGGALDFRDRSGSNQEAGKDYPLTVSRSGLDLQVRIGKQADPKVHARFAVGPDAGGFKAILAVQDDGLVTIDGTLAIDGAIDIGDHEGDRLILWGTAGEDGTAALGIEQTGKTLYQRARERYRWYINAKADTGASAKMELSAAALWLAADINVGIGTKTPNTKLHITGGSDVTMDASSGYLLIGDAGSPNLVMDDNEIQARNAGSPASLLLQKGGGSVVIATSRLVAKHTGNIGIGTDDPQTKLHITGGSDATLSPNSGYLLLGGISGLNLVVDDDEIQARNAGGASTLSLQRQGGNLAIGNVLGAHLVVDNDEIQASNGAGTSALNLQRQGGDLAVGTNKLVVQNGGDVGIGIAGPTAKLDVRGAIKFGASGNRFPVSMGSDMRMVAGHIPSNGVVNPGPGFNSDRLAGAPAGAYVVTFSPAFATAPIVVATPVRSLFEDNVLTITNITPSLFEVRIKDVLNADADTLQDTEFTFIAVGSV